MVQVLQDRAVNDACAQAGYNAELLATLAESPSMLAECPLFVTPAATASWQAQEEVLFQQESLLREESLQQKRQDLHFARMRQVPSPIS